MAFLVIAVVLKEAILCRCMRDARWFMVVKVLFLLRWFFRGTVVLFLTLYCDTTLWWPFMGDVMADALSVCRP